MNCPSRRNKTLRDRSTMVSTRNSPSKKPAPKLSPAKQGSKGKKAPKSTPPPPKKAKTGPAKKPAPKKSPPPKKAPPGENLEVQFEEIEGAGDDDEGDDEAEEETPGPDPAATAKLLAILVQIQEKQEQRFQEERLEEKQAGSKRLQHDADPLKVLETALKAADDDMSADYRAAIKLLGKAMPSADGGLQEDVKAATKPTGDIGRDVWASVVGKALIRWTSARSIENALSLLADPDKFPKNMREHRSFDAHLGYCIRLGTKLEEAKSVTGADVRAEDMVVMVNKIINKWPAAIVTALRVPSLVDGLDTLTSLSQRLRDLRPVVLENVNAAWTEHTDANPDRHGGGSNRRNHGVVGVADDARKGSSRNAYNERDRRSPSPRRRNSRNTRGRSRSRSRSPSPRRGGRKDRSRSPRRDRKSRSRSPPRKTSRNDDVSPRKTRRGTGSRSSKYACQRPECVRDTAAPEHDGKDCPLTICYNCKRTGHKSTHCPSKRTSAGPGNA